jgi:hypothetical protein
MVERRRMDDGSFLADGLTGSAPSLVFPTGRICIEPQCMAQLSRYNSTEWCALHESPASTQRPFDTSTRQRRSLRNSSRRRMTTRTSSNKATASGTGSAAAPTATSSASTPEPSAASSAEDKSVTTKAGRRTAA